MVDHGGQRVSALRRPQDGPKPREGLLASLATGPMSGRFCAWRGASDRRYVATVYPVDRDGLDAGLPDFQSFVLLAVSRRGGTRRVVDIAVVGRAGGRRAALATGLVHGADEWHVHFLGDDAGAHAALVADLRARHGAEDMPQPMCA